MNNRPAVVSDLFFVAGMVVVILFPAMQATEASKNTEHSGISSPKQV
jgi:hypothetical protein